MLLSSTDPNVIIVIGSSSVIITDNDSELLTLSFCTFTLMNVFTDVEVGFISRDYSVNEAFGTVAICITFRGEAEREVSIRARLEYSYKSCSISTRI